MAQEKVAVSIEGIKNDLNNGLDRKEIGKKYGLNPTNIKILFSDARLKGLKVKRKSAIQFEIVEDVNTTTSNVEVESVEIPQVNTVVENTPVVEEVTPTTTVGVW